MILVLFWTNLVRLLPILVKTTLNLLLKLFNQDIPQIPKQSASLDITTIKNTLHS